MKSPFPQGRSIHSLEPLESRIAPAALQIFLVGVPVGGQEGQGNSIQYTDTSYNYVLSTSPTVSHHVDAPFFIATASGTDPISTAVGGAAGVTYYHVFTAGQELVLYDPNVTGGKEVELVVNSGDVAAFFENQQVPGQVNVVHSGDLVSLSLSANAVVTVNGNLAGSVVTDLTVAGKGTAQSPFTYGVHMNDLVSSKQGIASLTVGASISGNVLSGGNIQRISFPGNLNSVGGIYAGSGADGQTIDFFPNVNSAKTGIVSTISVNGQVGASISNVSVGTVGTIEAGNGGAGAAGGSISNIQILNDTSGLNLIAGSGGNGINVAGFHNGGAGGSVSEVFLAGALELASATINTDSVLGGNGGDGDTSFAASTGGRGGAVTNFYDGIAFVGSTPIQTVNLLQDRVLVEGGTGGSGVKTGGAGGGVASVGIATLTPGSNITFAQLQGTPAQPGALGTPGAADLHVLAGDGGAASGNTVGVLAGAGGSVSNVSIKDELLYTLSISPAMPIPTGTVGVEAGDAGLTSGTFANGAAGGSVSNVTLEGWQESVIGGAGSEGRTGGAGGSLTNIHAINKHSVFTIDGYFASGAGGEGTGSSKAAIAVGAGGAGGSISGLRVDDAAFVHLTVLTGGGGYSALSRGGAGGLLTGVNVLSGEDYLQATNQAPLPNIYPAVSESIQTGAGGNGYLGGGAGGSFTNSTVEEYGGVAQVVLGNGGNALSSGNGGAGGGVNALDFIANTLYVPPGAYVSTAESATLTAGNGGSGVGLHGAGGAGGAVNSTDVTASGAATVLAGNGGGGVGGAAGSGGAINLSAVFAGSIPSTQVTSIETGLTLDNATMIAGSAGGSGAKPGVGGSIIGGTSTVSGAFGPDNVTIQAGNGSQGGAGGSLLTLGFGSPTYSLSPAPNGNILIQAGAGSAAGNYAGAGGSIAGISGSVGSNASGNVSFLAGAGGGDLTHAAAGGSVRALQISVEASSPAGSIAIAAGNAGDTGAVASGYTVKTGANGGSVTGVSIVAVASTGIGTTIQSIVAGDGGPGTVHGGVGGSITSISAPAFNIGQLTGASNGSDPVTGANTYNVFGVNSMGGLFAGLGGAVTAPTLNGKGAGAAGSVSYITANGIGSIVAGTSLTPGLVNTVSHITLYNLNGQVMPLPDAVGTSATASFQLTYDPIEPVAETTVASAATQEVQTVTPLAIPLYTVDTLGTAAVSGAKIVTVPSTDGLTVGMSVAGANVPAGDYITAVGLNNTITLHAGVNGALNDTPLTINAPAVPLTGTAGNGATVVAVSSTAGLSVGLPVVGGGVPAGDFIAAIGNGTITLNAPVTGALNNSQLTVNGAQVGYQFAPYQLTYLNQTVTINGVSGVTPFTNVQSALATEASAVQSQLSAIIPGGVTVTTGANANGEGALVVTFNNTGPEGLLVAAAPAKQVTVSENPANVTPNQLAADINSALNLLYPVATPATPLTPVATPVEIEYVTVAAGAASNYVVTFVKNYNGPQDLTNSSGPGNYSPANQGFGPEGTLTGVSSIHVDNPTIQSSALLIGETQGTIAHGEAVTPASYAINFPIVRISPTLGETAPNTVIDVTSGTTVLPITVPDNATAQQIQDAINTQAHALVPDGVTVSLTANNVISITLNNPADNATFTAFEQLPTAASEAVPGHPLQSLFPTETQTGQTPYDVQDFSIPSSGTFTLSFNGVNGTDNLSTSGPASSIATAIYNELNVIAPGAVASVQSDNTNGGFYVTFANTGTQPLIAVTPSNTGTAYNAVDIIQGASDSAGSVPQVEVIPTTQQTGNLVLSFDGSPTVTAAASGGAAAIAGALNSLGYVTAAGGVQVAYTPGLGGYTVSFNGPGEHPLLTVQSETQEVQTFTVNNIGAFNVTVPLTQNETTGLLPSHATAAQVQAALNALPGLVTATGGAVVTGGAEGTYTVTYNDFTSVNQLSVSETTPLVQTISHAQAPYAVQDFTPPTTGTYTVSWNGKTSSALAFNATAAQIQSALVPSVIHDGATVTSDSNGGYLVTFSDQGPEPLISVTPKGATPVNAIAITSGSGQSANEVQEFTPPTTGTYTLSWNGSAPSAPLAFNATAAQVQAALSPSVIPDGVTVTPESGSGLGFIVTFNDQGPEPLISVTANGGSATNAVELAQGVFVSKVDEVQHFSANPSASAYDFTFEGSQPITVLPSNGVTVTAADMTMALNGSLNSIFAAAGGVTVTGNAVSGFDIAFNQPGARALVGVAAVIPSVSAPVPLIVSETTHGVTPDEVQDLTPPASGTYTLSFNGKAITTPLAYNASSATVQAALDSVVPGGVTVAGDGTTTGLSITFNNAGPEPLIAVTPHGGKPATVVELAQGVAPTQDAQYFLPSQIFGGYYFSFGNTTLNSVTSGLTYTQLEGVGGAAALQAALDGLQTVMDAGGVTVTGTAATGFEIIFNKAGARPLIGVVEAAGLPLQNSETTQGQTPYEVQDIIPPSTGAYTLSITNVGQPVSVAALTGNTMTDAAAIQNALDSILNPVANPNGVTVASDNAGGFTVTFNDPGTDGLITVKSDVGVTTGAVELAQGVTGGSSIHEVQHFAPGLTPGAFYFTFDGTTLSSPALASGGAAAISTALNGLHNIIAAGGVTVTGTALTGYDITFNNPGARGLIGVVTPAAEVVTLAYQPHASFDAVDYADSNIVGAIANINSLGADHFKFLDNVGTGTFTVGDTPIDGIIMATNLDQSTLNFTPQARYVLFSDGKPVSVPFYDYLNAPFGYLEEALAQS